MEWTITRNKENHYVEIVTRGAADKDGSLDMAKAITSALRQMKIKKVLIDHSAISSVSGGTMEVFRRPKEFNEFGVIPEIKIAEIIKPEHQEFFKFLETVCMNYGFEFSLFNDKKSALEWLLKS